MRDDRTPLSEVAAIAEGDPALAAKVLQLVNSSIFGLLRQIVSDRANLAFAQEHATSLAEATRARMRVSQGGVGAYLLSLWGLPFEVIELVATQGSASYPQATRPRSTAARSSR